jgi:putative phage-type endonuclease
MEIIDIAQNSKEWYDLRKYKIGASDAPIILQESPWVTPIQLWERKLGFISEQEENDAMREGRRLEPIAREAFEREMQCAFPPCVGIHDEYPWMMASFDGLMHAVLEIKCPGTQDHLLASKGVVPEKYRYQLQHQLAVSGLDLAYYYSFDRVRYNLDGECEGHVIEVKRDQKMIDHMIKEELKFMQCLLTCTPPELTDRDFIHRNDERWLETAKRWKYAHEHLKIYQALEEVTRIELLDQIQGNTQGGGIKVQKVIRKGNVDYSSIPQLEGVNLDDYRKKATESWRITSEI